MSYFSIPCRLFCFILLLSLGIGKGYGQVIGQLRDTAMKRNYHRALLSLLRSDSSLIESTLSDRDGRFQFPGKLPTGNYILLVMPSNYATLVKQFKVRDSGEYDFGILFLSQKIDSLQAVVVTSSDLRPHLRRDTIEFNTTRIRMNANATVEEMIGRLAGLQVDAEGNITYNGQKIERVLVDGRELFGSDLTIVTRNLNADMIAKIQLIDSKTKESEFTGIDDGKRIKTLNLTLKEESKKGYFSKAEAGAGLQGYYQMSGILGSFKKSEQLMVLGLASNIGSTGFSGTSGSLGTGLYLESAAADPLGASAGSGIPQSVGGAAHYANDWGIRGDHADGYYRYGHILVRPFSNILTEQFLQDSTYTQSQQQQSINRMGVQSFDSHFTHNLDSFSVFQFTLRGANLRGENQFYSAGDNALGDIQRNSSSRSIQSNTNNKNWYGEMMWRIRGRKIKAQSLSIDVSMSGQKDVSGGYLYSLNRYFQDNGLLLSSDTIDQRKAATVEESDFNSKISFTKPLWKIAMLGIQYGFELDNSKTQQLTFDRGDGKYKELVDSLSNRYRNIFITQRMQFSFHGQGKTFEYIFGGNILQYDYQVQSVENASNSKYNYLDIVPWAIVNFSPSSLATYSVSYKSASKLPTAMELQPIQNNSDPLHITLGNSRLQPSYSRIIDFHFQRGRSTTYIGELQVGLVNNSISVKTSIDSLGRQISQALNGNGSRNGSAYFALNTRVMSLGIDIGFNSRITYDRSVNYVNELLSKNDTYTTGGGFSLAKYVANIYNFRINGNFLYTTTSSSINPDQKVSYWSQNHTAQAGFFPWKYWEINTNFNYTWRQKTSIFENHNSILLWNTSLNRNFFNNALTARIAVNDILGLNASVTRTITSNQISQMTSNVIGRYWMLSILYRFTTKKGK